MSSWNGTRQFQIFCYHRLKHFSFYLVYKFYNVTEDIKGVVVVPFSLKASGEKGGGHKDGAVSGEYAILPAKGPSLEPALKIRENEVTLPASLTALPGRARLSSRPGSGYAGGAETASTSASPCRFDYGDQFWEVKSWNCTCLCGSPGCRRLARSPARLPSPAAGDPGSGPSSSCPPRPPLRGFALKTKRSSPPKRVTRSRLARSP